MSSSKKPDGKIVRKTKSFVLGKHVTLTTDIFANAFGLITKGDEIEKWAFPPNIRVPNNQTTHFSLHNHLLHLILSHVIRPRGTKYFTVREADYWWLRCIQSGHKLHLVAFTFEDMVKFIKANKTKTLAYGMYFSHLFALLDIDTSFEAGIDPPTYNVLGRHSMDRLGYKEEPEFSMNWVKKRGEVPEDEHHEIDEEHDDEHMVDIPGASHDAGSRDMTLREVHDSLMSSIGSLLSHVDSRHDVIEARWASMGDEISALRHQFDSFPFPSWS
ncbi:hypothetical protein GQ457_03G023180 [Hibiscus cannabinus]